MQLALALTLLGIGLVLSSGMFVRKLCRSNIMRDLGMRWNSLVPSLRTCEIVLETEEHVESLGHEIGKLFNIGDVIFLTGDLGAGKSTFARGAIREKCRDTSMRVTSPTYLLDNSYEFEDGDLNVQIIHHFDLYRLPANCALGFLSIPAVFDKAICLIEWPERMEKCFIPPSYLKVELSIESAAADHIRRAKVSCLGDRWENRFALVASACNNVHSKP